MTCHKAQGATVDVALLYGTVALTREAGYVALSRGRTANHLYVADGTSGPATAGDGYLDELAARLSRRRTQTLATRQLPRTQRGGWDRPVDRPRLATSRRDLPMTDQLLLTPIEAARALGIGRSKLYELMQDGILESVHIGACRRIPTDALLALVTTLRGDRDNRAAS